MPGAFDVLLGFGQLEGALTRDQVRKLGEHLGVLAHDFTRELRRDGEPLGLGYAQRTHALEGLAKKRFVVTCGIGGGERYCGVDAARIGCGFAALQRARVAQWVSARRGALSINFLRSLNGDVKTGLAASFRRRLAVHVARGSRFPFFRH